jgi:hypothetical protein
MHTRFARTMITDLNSPSFDKLLQFEADDVRVLERQLLGVGHNRPLVGMFVLVLGQEVDDVFADLVTGYVYTSEKNVAIIFRSAFRTLYKG